MEYRKAIHTDIDILAKMRIDMLHEENRLLSTNQQQLLIDNTSKFFCEGLADTSVICWIAVYQHNIIGMGCTNFFSFPPNDWCPNGKTAYIGNMYTLPLFRGQGVATNILFKLIDAAKSRQCQRILLHTTDKGKKLYE